jgi:hypothetical protein
MAEFGTSRSPLGPRGDDAIYIEGFWQQVGRSAPRPPGATI